MPLSSPTEGRTRSDAPPFGTLFVVATPIGHMEDITLRALRTLKDVAVIAAEDTRKTRKLLTRHEISTPLISYHDHNKEQRTPKLLAKLKAGTSMALVTDAGTPSISDPGHFLVREAISQGVSIVPVPGASAVIAALSVSGLPTDSFVFVGFVPRKAGKRKALLDQLKDEPRTLIFYESPQRLLGLMRELLTVMGDRRAVTARELTKLHEQILRGPLSQMVQAMSAGPPLKGECTLLVAGCEMERSIDRASLQKHLRRLHEAQEGSLSDLVKEVARESGLPKRVVYEEALKMKKKD